MSGRVRGVNVALTYRCSGIADLYRSIADLYSMHSQLSVKSKYTWKVSGKNTHGKCQIKNTHGMRHGADSVVLLPNVIKCCVN